MARALMRNLNYKMELLSTDQSNDLEAQDIFLYVTPEISLYYFYNFDMTALLRTLHIIVIVPAGEPYTSIEKFFLPFDMETWIYFTLYFAIGFLTIAALNYSR